MRKCDIVFADTYFEGNSYSLEDAVSKMFECVENGTLCVRNFPNDEGNDSGYISCDMKLDENSENCATTELKAITENIRKIASLYGEKDIDADKLTAEEKEIYLDYIKALDLGENDAEVYSNLCALWFEGASYNNKELDFLRRCGKARIADAKRRIGDNFCALEVIVFAQRLYKLIALKAPRAVIENEEFCLIKAYIIHKFATSFEEIPG